MNYVIVKIDRSLDVEFPNRKYAIMLDLTSDASTGKPAMGFYCFKGTSLVTNQILGVGGRNGRTSGVVSSPIAGTKLVAWGTGGVAVFNPFKSVVLIGEESKDTFWF